jgi:hypothetical protein
MKIHFKIFTNLIYLLIFISFVSCKNEAQDKLADCLKITGQRFLGGTHQNGLAYGEANFVFNKNGESVYVASSVLGYSDRQEAKLENMELQKGGPDNTYKIVADYVVDGASAAGIRFYFCSFEDEKPNTILIQVSAPNNSWSSYKNITLSKEKFLLIKQILSINNEVLTEAVPSSEKLDLKAKSVVKAQKNNKKSNNEKKSLLSIKDYSLFVGQEYYGTIDSKDVKFKISWNNDKTITAIYYFTDNLNKMHSWKGTNFNDGELKITDYDDDVLIGNGTLRKTISNKSINWIGEINKENGVNLSVSIKRVK